ncbi:MAG TPA: transcription termination/antitermination NusG family protein [Blastocatellia bacterium]|nr:transcription termination/antitermination NusG family protein [Blastocatellia bacterium]
MHIVAIEREERARACGPIAGSPREAVFWSETNWFAVQARPFRENFAAAGVTKLDVEVFLPIVREEQVMFGAKRLITKPLFAGYFFARFSPLMSLDAVRYTKGVLRVVGGSRLPVPIEADVIHSIQGRVQADGFVHLERHPFRPGDKVAIEQGPFAGWMGKVERECDDGRRVLILLEAIEQARLLIESRWLATTSASA